MTVLGEAREAVTPAITRDKYESDFSSSWLGQLGGCLETFLLIFHQSEKLLLSLFIHKLSDGVTQRVTDGT